MGDFAILLRAGFDRWSAAKLQLSTALGGMLGACFAICTQSPKGVGTGMGVVRLVVAVSWGIQRGPRVAVGTHSPCSGRQPAASSFPCRGDGSLGPAFHVGRLPLHRPGQCTP